MKKKDESLCRIKYIAPIQMPVYRNLAKKAEYTVF
jgi:hypothetical protein